MIKGHQQLDVDLGRGKKSLENYTKAKPDAADPLLQIAICYSRGLASHSRASRWQESASTWAPLHCPAKRSQRRSKGSGSLPGLPAHVITSCTPHKCTGVEYLVQVNTQRAPPNAKLGSSAFVSYPGRVYPSEPGVLRS